MPWPMLHVAIANELYQYEPTPAFLLGSIAPDAVLVHPNNKEAYANAHLISAGKYPSVEALHDFYKRQVTAEMREAQRDFLLGYICHIYADMRWIDRKKWIKEQTGSNVPMRDLMWREENQLDFCMYRHSPWTNDAQLKLYAAPLFEVEGLCELQELDAFRKQVFTFLDNPENEPGIELQYVTEDVASEFARELAVEFRKLFEMLHV